MKITLTFALLITLVAATTIQDYKAPKFGDNVIPDKPWYSFERRVTGPIASGLQAGGKAIQNTVHAAARMVANPFFQNLPSVYVKRTLANMPNKMLSVENFGISGISISKKPKTRNETTVYDAGSHVLMHIAVGYTRLQSPVPVELGEIEATLRRRKPTIRKGWSLRNAIELKSSINRVIHADIKDFTTLYECYIPKSASTGDRLIEISQFGKREGWDQPKPLTVIQSTEDLKITRKRGAWGALNPAQITPAIGATDVVKCQMLVDTDFVLTEGQVVAGNKNPTSAPQDFTWDAAWIDIKAYERKQHAKIEAAKSKGIMATLYGWRDGFFNFFGGGGTTTTSVDEETPATTVIVPAPVTEVILEKSEAEMNVTEPTTTVAAIIAVPETVTVTAVANATVTASATSVAPIVTATATIDASELSSPRETEVVSISSVLAVPSARTETMSSPLQLPSDVRIVSTTVATHTVMVAATATPSHPHQSAPSTVTVFATATATATATAAQ